MADTTSDTNSATPEIAQIESRDLSSANMLSDLPDELCIEVVNAALATNKVVNLGPETMQQDIERIKRELLHPLAQSPDLLAIAEDQYQKQAVTANLVYRLHLESVSILRSERDEQGHVTPHYDTGPSKPSDSRDLFFDNDGELAWVGIDAQHIKNLEVIIPAEAHSIMAAKTWKEAATYVQSRFAALPRAFPALERLTVRLTTYGIGSHPVAIYDVDTGQVCDDDLIEPKLRSELFSLRVQDVLAAVDNDLIFGHLRARDIILHQRPQRDWRTWRNGPLEEPLTDLARASFGFVCSVIDWWRAAWQMMDLPSCRVVFPDTRAVSRRPRLERAERG